LEDLLSILALWMRTTMQGSLLQRYLRDDLWKLLEKLIHVERLERHYRGKQSQWPCCVLGSEELLGALSLMMWKWDARSIYSILSMVSGIIFIPIQAINHQKDTYFDQNPNNNPYLF
jgi:hypothetical protein